MESVSQQIVVLVYIQEPLEKVKALKINAENVIDLKFLINE